MADIQFEGEQEFARPAVTRESGGLIALVQKWGFAKDNHQAEYVLLGIAVVAVIAAIFVFSMSGSSAPPPALNIDGTYPAPL